MDTKTTKFRSPGFTDLQVAARYLLDIYTFGQEEDRLEYDAEQLAQGAGLSLEYGQWIYDQLRQEEYYEIVWDVIQIEYNMTADEVKQQLEPITLEYFLETIENNYEGFETPAIPTLLRLFWDMAMYRKNLNT